MRSLSQYLIFCALAASPESPALAAGAAPRDLWPVPSLSPLVDSVKGAVVNVDVETRGEDSEEEGAEERVNPFFRGRNRPPANQVRQEKGSGFIIDPKGLVLTNNHVVKGAIAIRVHLDDGRVLDADILGRDPPTDVALLKVKGKYEPLPFVQLGDSDAIRVGDWAVAIGNPFGLASSVSAGIISARARNIGATGYDDFLQTDAAINLGNSGGPLFNSHGEVIGINTAIVQSATGIGFAVPINMAKALLPQLEGQGRVTRGWLGVGIQDLTPDLARGLGVLPTEGAILTQVNAGSPAEKAGLRVDDVVATLDGERVQNEAALRRAVAFKRPATVVTLTVYRGAKKQDVQVHLGTRPDLEGEGPTAPKPPEVAAAPEPLGLQFSDMDPRLAQHAGLPSQGALVTDASPTSAAERAQLARGMLILEAGGKPIRNAADLTQALKSAKPGTMLLMRVLWRGRKELRALALP